MQPSQLEGTQTHLATTLQHDATVVFGQDLRQRLCFQLSRVARQWASAQHRWIHRRKGHEVEHLDLPEPAVYRCVGRSRRTPKTDPSGTQLELHVALPLAMTVAWIQTGGLRDPRWREVARYSRGSCK